MSDASKQPTLRPEVEAAINWLAAGMRQPINDSRAKAIVVAELERLAAENAKQAEEIWDLNRELYEMEQAQETLKAECTRLASLLAGGGDAKGA